MINQYPNSQPYFSSYIPPVAVKQQHYQIDPNVAAKFPGNIFTQGPSFKYVALTFDDAPDSLFAPVMLDIFSRYNIKVTFFCLGNCVHQNSDMLKQIAREGHIIGNHTYDHVDLSKLPPNQVRDQIQRTADEIYRAIGLKTALFRPPFGFLSDESAQVIISMGYKIIMWNVDSYDWMGLTGPGITGRVNANVSPGSIVLMHNACSGSTESGTGTTQSLPFIIETLKASGYTFVTIPALLNIPAYNS
ncbi:MAG TPA: polysaccharide deacetylase family protein [Firmicutes bacterium]|jgi:peptidoglycan-N-acetylglucosamine deacetylase|nr:polysaccharide deacetylase family protein [Bacillota bacterium]